VNANWPNTKPENLCQPQDFEVWRSAVSFPLAANGKIGGGAEAGLKADG